MQHALRAFTPRDQKAIKTMADTMRPNPKLDLRAAISELAVGEALISFLDEGGTPCVTERAFVAPPGSRIGPLTPEERAGLIRGSLVASVYEQAVDRESAFEMLRMRAQGGAASGGGGAPTPVPAPGAAPATPSAPAGSSAWGDLNELLFGRTGPRGGHQPGRVDALATSAARSVGSAVAREITRGIFGSLLGSKRR